MWLFEQHQSRRGRARARLRSAAADRRQTEETLYDRYVVGRKWAFGSLVRVPRPSWRPPQEVLFDSSAVKAHRSASVRKGGAKSNHPRSRGGRTTKILALDPLCRPISFMLTGDAVANCMAGAALPERLPYCKFVHDDNGYDTHSLRRQNEASGETPNIPPKSNRQWKNCFSPVLYPDRNAIVRMFIATRYNRNTVNFLATDCIVATVSYWL